MKIKKIIAAVAAAAMAISMSAISAFATTLELDSEYVGSWAAGKTISKADLEAVGGDVKVTLTVEWKSSIIEDQHIFAVIDYDNSWTKITDQLTSDEMYAKADGFIGVAPDQTSVSFVISADTIASLGDSGIGFLVQNVIIKSAELEAGSPAGAITILEEEQVWDYSNGNYDPKGGSAAVDEAPAADEAPAEEAPAAAESAPAADNTTASATTGNVPAAVMVSVMAVAGAAVVASRKRK